MTTAPRTLVSRNITVYGRRTSMRQPEPIWDALEEIAIRERISISTICAEIDRRLFRESASVSLSSAIRVFVASYFRRAATDDGHLRAGHGCGHPFGGTPFDDEPPFAPTMGD